MSSRSFLRSSRADYVNPTSGGVTQMELFTPRDDWTSDVYGRLTGGRTPSVQDPHPVLRGLSMFFAIVLFLLGIALIVGGAVLATGTVFEFCTNCTVFIVGIIVLGVIVVIISVVGITSTCLSKHKPLSVTYGILLVVIGIICLVACGGSVFLRNGGTSQTANFARLWKDMAKHDTQVICDIQEALQCSGYYEKECCYSNLVDGDDGSGNFSESGSVEHDYCYIVENGKTENADTRDEIQWPSEFCVAKCASNHYTNTCEAPLEKKFHSAFVPLVVILAVLGAMFLAFAGFAFCRSFANKERAGYVQYEY